MANMSYCRFQNTKNDMDDCLESLRYGEQLSEDEFKACQQMFYNLIDFLVDFGIVEDDGEIDDRLNDFLDGFKKE